ncbi:MAG TPA: hypothetical protein VH913_12160 [Hyphomicrobiaceae bacterium]|jgi:hypothetical protein
MAQHKFKVGQVVDYRPGRLAGLHTASRYKVLRLLPAEGSDLLYRIKAVDETCERVARERELSQRDGYE